MMRPSGSIAIDTAGGILRDSFTFFGGRLANSGSSAKGWVHRPVFAGLLLAAFVDGVRTAATSTPVITKMRTRRIRPSLPLRPPVASGPSRETSPPGAFIPFVQEEDGQNCPTEASRWPSEALLGLTSPPERRSPASC